MRRINKKYYLQFLIIGLVLTAGLLFHVKGQAQVVDTDYVHWESFSIEDYLETDTSGKVTKRKAPIPTEKGYEGYLFAGWYQDDAVTGISSTETSGTYYAKFVPQEILSVYCQTLAGTTKDTQSTKLRLVSMVDALEYNCVGFQIGVNGKNVTYQSSSVCEEITAGDVAFAYKPTDIHPAAKYFTTVTVTGFTNEKFSMGVHITPFWKTVDGTMVYGVGRYARIEDSYLGIVNVPIRMYSDATVAAGSLTVNYDHRKFRYHPNDDGSLDLGNSFTKMMLKDNGTSVTCIGNVENISQNIDANDLYVNLRFEVIERSVLCKGGDVFNVESEAFYDKSEKNVVIDVADVVHKPIDSHDFNYEQGDTSAVLSDKTMKRIVSRFNTMDAVATVAYASDSCIVDLRDDDVNLSLPQGAIYSGTKALEVTSKNYEAITCLDFGTEMERLDLLDNDDYYLLWMYRTATLYSGTGNNYLLGAVNSNGVFDLNAIGQSTNDRTTLTETGTVGQWYSVKFTVAELKEAMQKQGARPATHIRFRFNVDSGENSNPQTDPCKLYFYSVEFCENSEETVTRFDTNDGVAVCSWDASNNTMYTAQTVNLVDEGIQRPEGAVDIGDSALKLTAKNWNVRSAICFGDEMSNINSLSDEDYFLLWCYRDGGQYNSESNYYILGDLNANGVFNISTDATGQSTQVKTNLGCQTNYRNQWYTLKFTVADIKAALQKQGLSSATWMFIQQNIPNDISWYLYSVEYHKASKDNVVTRFDTMDNVAPGVWDATTNNIYTASIVNLTDENINLPQDATIDGNQALKLTAKDWYVRSAIYFGETLKNLDNLSDEGYFLLWCYRDAGQYDSTSNYYILGDLNSSNVFNLSTTGTGQSTAVRTQLPCYTTYKNEWYSIKFTVADLKETLEKQQITSAEWMYFQQNVPQNSSMYLYSIEYHESSDILGDANGDDRVDVRDAIRVLRYLQDDTIEVAVGADAYDNGTIEKTDISSIYDYYLEQQRVQKIKERVVLANFESFDDIYNVMTDYDNISFTGHYTLSSLSDRKSKVEAIAGDSSLELHIEGMTAENYSGYAKDAGTSAHIAYNLFDNTKNGGNWGFEWKYLSGTSVDIYNDNDFDIHVSMFYVCKSVDAETQTDLQNRISHNYGTIVVPAKSSTTLDVNISRQFMQHENSRNLSIICFTIDYDRQVLEDGSLYYPEAYVYFDNLTVELDPSPVTVNKKLDSLNEILYFDEEPDLDYVREIGERYLNESVNTWVTHEWTEGTGSSVHYNKNPQYIHDGNIGSLEWRINPTLQQKYKNTTNQYLLNSDYRQRMMLTGFSVEGHYIDQLDLTSLQKGGAKILVDVYNAGTFDKEVAFGIHDNDGLTDTDQWYKLPSGEWTTLEIADFSEIDWTVGIARLWLLTSVRDVEEPMSFYVNNLRIEYDGNEAKHTRSGICQYEWRDSVAPKIMPEYEYSIVKLGETVTFPDVTYSESNLMIVYELDGKTVSGNQFTPSKVGEHCLKIIATDKSGNTSAKCIYYKACADGNIMHKIYALDDLQGLTSHLGKGALNNLHVVMTDFASYKDLNGNSAEVNVNETSVEQEMYQKGITSGISLQLYKTQGHAKITNPLSVNWDKEYNTLYFYFYNGGYGDITINFNNWTRTIKANSGWQKIIIGDANGKTDYTSISSLGNSGWANSIVDLEDGVGTFITFTSNGNYYEECLMTAIYGE